MIKQEYKHSDLTAKIIGCAMTVHSTIGNGFQEVIYQQALAIELPRAGIGFSREYEMPIYYLNLPTKSLTSSSTTTSSIGWGRRAKANSGGVSPANEYNHPNNTMIKEMTGNAGILTLPKTAFLCSNRIPAAAVLRCYDWAIAQRESGACVISGFHSVLERDVLWYLLKGTQPIIVALARGMKQGLEPGLARPWRRGGC